MCPVHDFLLFQRLSTLELSSEGNTSSVKDADRVKTVFRVVLYTV